MTLVVSEIQRAEVKIAGDTVFSIENVAAETGTINVPSGPRQNASVTEAVQRTVSEYGETLRKLSNE